MKELPEKYTVTFTPDALYELFNHFYLESWTDLAESDEFYTDEDEQESLLKDAEMFCELISLDKEYAPIIVKGFLDQMEGFLEDMDNNIIEHVDDK